MRVAGRSASWFVLGAGFLALLLAAARPGPDFGPYMAWARAAATGDIFALGGDIASPTGVPLSMWSHGTGFVFALGAPLRRLTGAATRAAVVVGWLAVVAFWWAMLGLLAHAAGGERSLVILGAVLLFLGTHAGFYSTVHASESLSLACLAVAARALVTLRPFGVRAALLAGASLALLVVVRPNLAVYAALATAVAATVARRDGGARAPVVVAVFVAPLVVAAAQVGLVDRWMTGSVLRSPYDFGSGSFRSLDLMRPHLLAVLAGPLHGLLPYHPLYGVGVVALLAGIARGATAATRLLYVGILLAVAAHVWVQASWYCWWLGMGTFGMRGLAVLAVILVPVLVRALHERDGRPSGVALLIASVAACVWSYLLLRQGETSFFSWGQLLRGQWTAFGPESAVVPLAAAALGAGAWLGVAGGSRRLGVAGALGGLAVGWLVGQRVRLGPPAEAAVVLVAVPVIALAGAGPVAWGVRRPAVAHVVLVVFVAAFVAVSGAFAVLAVRTERAIRDGAMPARAIRYRTSAPLDEALASYVEYTLVPGFDRDKAALRDFLMRETNGAAEQTMLVWEEGVQGRGAAAPIARHLVEHGSGRSAR